MKSQFNEIDHVHLYVPRRDEAADWHLQVPGFRMVDKLLFWATPSGPLNLEGAFS